MTRIGIRLAGLTLGLLALALAGRAQDVALVRAVEHPEYSRLVLPLPAGVDWQLMRDGAQATVRLSGPAPAYDLSGVFDRMPRTRILSASARRTPDGQAIDLTLACSCEVSPEAIGSGYLAIDVRRRVGEADAGPAEPRFLRPDTAMRAPEPGGGPEPAAGSAASEPGVAAEADPPAPSELAAETAAAPVVEEAEDPVLAARAELMRQLTRAADAGILTLSEGAVPPAPAEGVETGAAGPTGDESAAPAPADHAAEPGDAGHAEAQAAAHGGGDQDHAAADAPAEASLSDQMAAALSPHLSLRGPNDPARRSAPETAAPEVPRCIGDEALDVADWAMLDTPFAEALGPMRSRLVGPDGKIDAGAVRELSQLYIGSGFGREALSMLQVMGENVPERALLADLAQVIEGRAPAPEGPVQAAEACLGRITLWRAAAGIEPVAADSPGAEEVRRSMEELPPILRRLLGQAVVSHALSAGEPDAARRILDLLDRTPGGMTARERIVRARLALADGNPERSLELTDPLFSVSTPDPELLLVRSAAALALGTAPDDLLSGIDIALPLYPAEGDVGLELRLARVRLEAARPDWLSAMGGLRRLSVQPGIDADAVSEVAREVLASVPDPVRRSETGARAILENVGFLSDDAESQALRQEYARALVAGGLPGAALELLGQSGRLGSADERLVAAEAHLARGEAEETLAALAGVADARAEALRAQAYLRAGNMSAGFRALAGREAEDPERNRLAALSQSWTEVVPRELSGGLDALANYAQTQPAAAPPDPQARTLDVAAAALERSSSLRAVLDKLGDPPAALSPR